MNEWPVFFYGLISSGVWHLHGWKKEQEIQPRRVTVAWHYIKGNHKQHLINFLRPCGQNHDRTEEGFLKFTTYETICQNKRRKKVSVSFSQMVRAQWCHAISFFSQQVKASVLSPRTCDIVTVILIITKYLILLIICEMLEMTCLDKKMRRCNFRVGKVIVSVE